MLTIAFFVRHFTERGTEVAIYDYAHHNETILGNRSIVLCFSEAAQKRVQFPSDRASYSKFKDRFPIFEIESFDDMAALIHREGIDIFYTLTSGDPEPMYKFSNKQIWGKCRTVKHCVFSTIGPEADCYVGISDYLNQKFGTSYPIIPHMIDLPPCSETMRKELGIPNDAIVLGRHGGYVTFDLQITTRAIRRFLEKESNVYFLFMNTRPFYEHPRIIHIDRTTDLGTKSKFINTCDAMIHGRIDGEIFPISIGEFSIFNKPIITAPAGDTGHIFNLREKAILYHSEDELLAILNTIEIHLRRYSDWNMYKEYTPKKVMNIFEKIVCAPKPTYIHGLPPFLKVRALG